MAHSRRDFLRNTACALGGVALASTVESLGLINAYAQTGAATDYRALVCVFLNGGNDCNNTVVDINQFASYSNVRSASDVAVARELVDINDRVVAVVPAVQEDADECAVVAGRAHLRVG